MVDFTTVVGIDETHAREFELTWPTWRRHRPELLKRPLLLVCDGAKSAAHWDDRLRFVDHPARSIVLWNQPGVSQREKMLTGLALGALPHVATAWHAKLDTDAVAFSATEWPKEEWFKPDDKGRAPAFIASPWGYTKPAEWLTRLGEWARSVPELRNRAEIRKT